MVEWLNGSWRIARCSKLLPTTFYLHTIVFLLDTEAAAADIVTTILKLLVLRRIPISSFSLIFKIPGFPGVLFIEQLFSFRNQFYYSFL